MNFANWNLLFFISEEHIFDKELTSSSDSGSNIADTTTIPPIEMHRESILSRNNLITLSVIVFRAIAIRVITIKFANIALPIAVEDVCAIGLVNVEILVGLGIP